MLSVPHKESGQAVLIMPLPTDRSMQSRFSGAIAKWIRLSNVNELPATDAAEYISTFQFTNGSTFT
jgi:hypothetical protein